MAAVISFIGSMQPGPVNLAVLYHASQQRFAAALTTAVGGSIPEFVFSFVALRFFLVTKTYIAFLEQFGFIFDLLLIVVGLILLFNTEQKQHTHISTPKQGFLSGMILALINPQLLIFWFGIITALSIEGIKLMLLHQQLAFAIGTSIGAFLLHVTLLCIVKNNTHNRWLEWFKQYSVKIIGGILVTIGTSHIVYTFFK